MVEEIKNLQDLPELPEEDEELEKLNELLKKSAEFTQEKKIEEKPEVAPEAEEKEESQEKTQKELPEIFSSPENKSLFEKLSDKTKEFAGSLYANARMDIVDRAKVMFNDKLLNWHYEKSKNLKDKREESDQKIERLEAGKIKHTEILNKFQREAGHLLDAKTLTKATLEKEDLQKQIDKEKTRMERMQSSLEWRNQKKDIYERQRNNICEDVLGRIKEKLQPFGNKLENLKGQREQLNSEIENFKNRKEGLARNLGTLEEEAKNATFKFERKLYASRIKEIKNALKESENLIKDRSKSENKISKDIAKFGKKAAPWQNKETEFKRIKERKVAETIVPREKRKEEKSEWAEKEEAVEHNWDSILDKEKSLWIEITGEEETGRNYFKAYKGDFAQFLEKQPPKKEEDKESYLEKWLEIRGDEKKEEAEKEPEFTVGEFVAKWNGYFGSKVPLSVERMGKVLDEKYNAEKEVSLDFFLKELKAYYVFAKGSGLIDKKKIKEKDFKKYLNIFEDIVKKKD